MVALRICVVKRSLSAAIIQVRCGIVECHGTSSISLVGGPNRSSDASCTVGQSHRLSYYSPQIFDVDVWTYFGGFFSISSLHLVKRGKP